MPGDLRRGLPHVFENDHDESRLKAFRRAVAEAEATQRVRYAVAPTCTLQLTDGRLLREGHSLVIDDLVGLVVDHRARTHEVPWQAMRRHLFECRVLERENKPEISAYAPEAGPVEYVPISVSREGLPIRFGDEESTQRFERAFIEAYDVQRVRFAVAPQCSLGLPDGRLLPAGASLALRDLIGSTYDPGDGEGRRAETAHAAMRRHVRAGLVIHRHNHPEVPAE